MPEVLEGEAVPQRLEIDICRSLDRPTEVTTSLRSDGEAGLGTLVGEFSLFNEWYEIASWWEGNFLERIAPGAFKRTINNRSGQSPVRVLLEHGFDPTVADKPLGVPNILEERAAGPYAETPLLDTSYNRDLAPALAAGAYGQSFRFQVLVDEWVEEPGVSDYNPKGLPERTIKEVRLIEFGPTVFPASPTTNGTTGLRSSTDHFYEQLARRDSDGYDAAVRSVRSLRASAPPAKAVPELAAPELETPEAEDRTTEDPQAGHSTDPVDAPPAADHSEDSPQSSHSTEPATPTSPSRKDNVMPNMTIEEREARQSEIRTRFTEIDVEYAGAALPDEVRKEWNALQAELVEHDQAIQDQLERREYLRQIASNPEATETQETTITRTATAARKAPNTRIKSDNIYDLSAIRQQAVSEDDLPRLYRDYAMRAVEQHTFPGVDDRAAAQAQVERHLNTIDDEKSTLARRIIATGSPTYERAFGKAIQQRGVMGLSTEEQRALSLGIDADGGYAVPFELDPTIVLTSDGVIDPLRSIARVETITGKEWQGITSEGVTVSRSAEAAEADDDSPTLDQPTVVTSRVDGFIPFSVELEMAWNQLKSELTMLLADAKAAEEANSFVNGTGATAGGITLPQGVLVGATTLVPTASATALTRGDLYKVKNALPPRFRARAQWLAETSFYDAVRDLDENGDVWAELSGDVNPRLLNKPTNEASEMPSFSLTAAAKAAIFGDFSKFLIVDRAGMSVELIPQVFGGNGRPTGQRGIFVWWHNGSKVLVPGAFRVLQMKPAA